MEADDAGNRLSGPGGSLTYPVDTENKWSSAEGGAIDYTFDSAGRAVLRDPGTPYRLEYNEEGWLESIEENDQSSKQTNYTRDYRGLRVEKDGWGGSGLYSYDPQGRIIGWEGPADYVVECTEWGIPRITHWETHTPYETYIYLGGQRVAIVKSHYETGNSNCGTGGSYHVDDVYHLINDKMGQAIGIRRASDWKSVWRADLDEWGNPISINEDPDGLGAYTYNMRLPGQNALTQKEGGGSLNQGGLVENWYQVYDSVAGKYSRVDPIRFAPDPRQIVQPYSYAASQPLYFVDPDGRIVVRDKTDACRRCDPLFVNYWDAGLRIAQEAALRPSCQQYFARLNLTSIFDVMFRAGSPPTVVLGGRKNPLAPNEFGHFSPITSNIKINCAGLSDAEGGPRLVAQTLIHELAHWALRPTGGTSLEDSFRDIRANERRGDFNSTGYAAEDACLP